MLEVTKRLGGENYVLWGGREGYDTLLNTDLRREGEQLARFLHLVAEHKHKIGFTGTLLIEPKPMEPTKHQYDYDVATVHGFLVRNGLEASTSSTSRRTTPPWPGTASTTRSRTRWRTACSAASTPTAAIPRTAGTPTSSRTRSRTSCCRSTRSSGRRPLDGRLQLRRQAPPPEPDRTDLFHAHIGGIDTLARALSPRPTWSSAATLAAIVETRYAGWKGELGTGILDGSLTLADLAAKVESGEIDPQPESGLQELLENVVNQAIWSTARSAG
jgi:xylose isomerase